MELGDGGWFGAEKVFAAGARSGTGFREIGSVAVYVEMHFAGLIAEYGVRMRCTVVQEVDDGLSGSFGA